MATDNDSIVRVGKGDVEYKRYQLVTAPDVKAVNIKDSTFEGFSAGIGNTDGGDDVIEPGAFTKSIKERVASSRVKFLDQHRTDTTARLLGKVIAAEERKATPTERKDIASRLGIDVKDAPSHRLWSKFLVSSKRGAQDALIDISEGILDGLSIGYRPIRVEFRAKDDTNGDDDDPELAWLMGRGIRHLHEVAWWETSAVIWGMNAAALVLPDSVKATLDRVAGLEDSDEEHLNEKQILYAIRALKDLLGNDQEAEMRMETGQLEELIQKFDKAMETLARLDLTSGAKDAADELEEIVIDAELSEEKEDAEIQVSLVESLDTVNAAVQQLQGLAGQMESLLTNDDSGKADDAEEESKEDSETPGESKEDTEDSDVKEDAGETPEIPEGSPSDPAGDSPSDEHFTEKENEDVTAEVDIDKVFARLSLIEMANRGDA